MGKIKKRNKKVDSENITNRKTAQNKKSANPFEVQVNREKFQVLGRDTQTSRGRPGASRSKGIQKRKDTLGKEYLNKHKRNEFQDKRIGVGRDGKVDDVLTARFMAEKMAQYKSNKKSIFNLNDDEVLTHKGQTLEEIEQFNDNASEEDDAEDEGRLAAEFTETAHFGGGDNDENQQNRKTAIEELILESKKRKLEKLKEKEEVEELTTALDEKWKTLIPVMSQYTTGDIEKPKADDYDKMMREMIFEPRGEVTDRLMSSEVFSKRERERLEQLEKERLERMSGDQGKPKEKHRSADELDDGYFLNPPPVKQTKILAYDVNGQEFGNPDNMPEGEDNPDKENEDDLDNNDAESNPDDDNDDDDEEDESCDEDAQEEVSEDGSDQDNLSDLKEDSSSSDEEDSEQEEADVAGKVNTKPIQKNHKKLAKTNELPYTFEIPKVYEEFCELLAPHSNDLKVVIIERMIKSNHPKTAQEGSQKITLLFTYLIQFLNDEFVITDVKKIMQSFNMLNQISAFLFDLAQLLPESSTIAFKELIKEKQEAYRKRKKKFCGVEVLVFLKLTSLIFPTSDFRHRVVTPALVYISEMLSNARIKTRSDIARGLFLVCLSYEYNSVAKRFLPAALNFLLGVLYLCIKKRPIEILKIIPPFKSSAPLNSLLTIDSDHDNDETEAPDNFMMTSQDLVASEINLNFKIRCFGATIDIVSDMFENLAAHETISYYAANFLEMLERIDETSYPEKIRVKLAKTIAQLNEINNRPLKPLVIQKRRPKALRMIEPKFEKQYDGSKKFLNLPTEKEEKQKLLHKIKRETKGAIREIRRDNEFIAKIQLKKQIQSDIERKEKVKRIYAEASIQQGELNALDRSRKKKK